jgi:hypothetical protein
VAQVDCCLRTRWIGSQDVDGLCRADENEALLYAGTVPRQGRSLSSISSSDDPSTPGEPQCEFPGAVAIDGSAEWLGSRGANQGGATACTTCW